jgi:endonuclease YncB( thermonuclease family)
MKLPNIFLLAISLSCCASVATNERSPELQNNVDIVMNNGGRICSNGIKVIDGNTIELDGKRIRLMCVDTPESYYQGKKQYCLDNETNCGKLAKDAMEKLIAEELNKNESICCAWNKKDRYGRYLGWCGGSGEPIIFSEYINYDLIVNGYAWFYDGGKECDILKEPFVKAKKEKRGLFNENLGGFQELRLWRKTKSNEN